MRRFFFSSDFCRLIAQKAAVIVFLVTVCYNETNRDLRRFGMKRELGIARCGRACCLCSENDHCSGCSSNDCPDKDWCENRKCSIEKQYAHCYDCKSTCRKGLLSKIKPYGFTVFVKRYGEAERRSFWTALQGTKKRVLSIIAKGSAATMTPSTM